MPISLTELDADRATATISYRGMAMDVTFRPSRITAALSEEVATISAQRGEAAGLAHALSALVDAWDLLDNGRPYPLTPEALVRLPVPFLWATFAGLKDALKPAGDERKN